MGLKNLKAFNYALLGKWLWRLRVDDQSLWVKILRAKYGFEGGSLKLGGRLDSGWIRDLVENGC